MIHFFTDSSPRTQTKNLNDIIKHINKIHNDVSSWYKRLCLTHILHTTLPNTMEYTFKSNYSCDIGFNRCILVECKKGKNFIDFATVSVSDEIACRVRHKSLRLPINGWIKFTQALEEIENSFSQLCLGEDIKLKLDLGAHIYISMCGGVLCVDLRTHYKDVNGELQPGRPGIGFKLSEFQELLNITQEVTDRFSEEKPEASGRDTPDIALLNLNEQNNKNNCRPIIVRL
jgi:hypothetical protein